MIYQSDNISVAYLKPGIARFAFNAKGSVNKFDQQTLTDCKTALDLLHSDSALKGVIFCSEKDAFIVESGVKYSLVGNDNQLDFLSEQNGQLLKDIGRSNRFNYNEQIIAAYISAEYQWKKWFFKAGLRNETTFIRSTSDNPEVVNAITRNNLFPTVFALYEVAEEQQIGFSYGKRIDRPVYDFLNPSKSYYNYYSYFQGDPYLKSALIDNLRLTYTVADCNY